jgi:hypothetical protein
MSTKPKETHPYMWEGSIIDLLVWVRFYTYSPTHIHTEPRDIPERSITLPLPSGKVHSHNVSLHSFAFHFTYKRRTLNDTFPYFDLLCKSPSVSALRPLQNIIVICYPSGHRT